MRIMLGELGTTAGALPPPEEMIPGTALPLSSAPANVQQALTQFTNMLSNYGVLSSSPSTLTSVWNSIPSMIPLAQAIDAYVDANGGYQQNEGPIGSGFISSLQAFSSQISAAATQAGVTLPPTGGFNTGSSGTSLGTSSQLPIAGLILAGAVILFAVMKR